MRISDWSSDVCSSDLAPRRAARRTAQGRQPRRSPQFSLRTSYFPPSSLQSRLAGLAGADAHGLTDVEDENLAVANRPGSGALLQRFDHTRRSEEHTSELQSLMRISSAVLCLQKKQTHTHKS